MLWHYSLHQMKLFKDFNPKKEQPNVYPDISILILSIPDVFVLQVNPQVAQWFSAVDQDRSGQVTVRQTLLFPPQHFKLPL